MKSFTFLAVFLLLALFSSIITPQENTSDVRQSLLERYVRMWNEGDFSNMKEVLHPQFELMMSPEYEAQKGIDKLRDEITKTRTAYPDFHIKISEFHMDSSSASALWTITATHTGKGSMPPTGKKVEVMGMSLIHFKDNLIKDEWISGNDYLWMKQLGFSVIPPSGHK